jgi:hypothetical protein
MLMAGIDHLPDIGNEAFLHCLNRSEILAISDMIANSSVTHNKPHEPIVLAMEVECKLGRAGSSCMAGTVLRLERQNEISVY